MGRYPFTNWWEERASDEAICTRAMQVAGCEQWANRYIDQLSGGERQRVLFAAILAQEPAALLLDEPGTFIDLPHQIQMFRTLRSLCSDGLLCIAATHDLNLAAAFCTRLVLLENGTVAADGTPAEVFQGAAFRRVFGEFVQVVSATPGTVRIHYAF
jgi:iron complex transport system ATP-binding protein